MTQAPHLQLSSSSAFLNWFNHKDAGKDKDNDKDTEKNRLICHLDPNWSATMNSAKTFLLPSSKWNFIYTCWVPLIFMLSPRQNIEMILTYTHHSLLCKSCSFFCTCFEDLSFVEFFMWKVSTTYMPPTLNPTGRQLANEHSNCASNYFSTFLLPR